MQKNIQETVLLGGPAQKPKKEDVKLNVIQIGYIFCVCKIYFAELDK